MPMLALLAAAAQLMIVVPHDAAARGQLRALEPFADRAQLVLALGEGNTVADSAIDSLLRWPELVAVEIVPPLSVRDAGLLSRLKRLSVRLPPIFPAADAGALAAAPGAAEPTFIPLRTARREVPSLALLGAAMVRVERAPPGPLAPGPCPGSEERVLASGASELRIEGPVSACLLDWLHNKLDTHAEKPGELSPLQAPPPAPPPRKRSKH